MGHYPERNFLASPLADRLQAKQTGFIYSDPWVPYLTQAVASVVLETPLSVRALGNKHLRGCEGPSETNKQTNNQPIRILENLSIGPALAGAHFVSLVTFQKNDPDAAPS